MILEAVAEFLKSERVAVGGKDLFIHEMPSKVSIGVLLLTPLSGTTINHELPKYRTAGFQVIVRHTDHVNGRLLVDQVMASLTMANVTLGGLKVNFIRPKHEPVVYPTSEGDFLEFSVNYDANYVMA